MISPSRSPSERIVCAVISGKIVSSILSRSKAFAYLVQSSTSQPAFRKNSNQSIVGPFFGRGGLGDFGSACNDLRRTARGSSSERTPAPVACPDCLPVSFSMYFISSGDIRSIGTSITTPLTLCSRSFPLLSPKNSASTLY